MSNLSDELRKLCAMLNPYAECRSRIDYSCIVCQAAAELERITTENERLGRTESLYEELRSIIDGGSETMTHADAVQELHDTDDEVESLEQKLEESQKECRRLRDDFQGAQCVADSYVPEMMPLLHDKVYAMGRRIEWLETRLANQAVLLSRKEWRYEEGGGCAQTKYPN